MSSSPVAYVYPKKKRKKKHLPKWSRAGSYLVAVHAEPVFVREEGDSLHGHLVGGAEDADGDLSSVGDQDLLEHLVLLAGGGSADGIDRVFLVMDHGLAYV